MGNNGSRKSSEEINSDLCGQTAEAMKKAEESSGNTPTDSYDKLIAWMVEMAETDDLPVDTLDYANHMTKKVSHQKRRHSATENHQSSSKSAGSFRCFRSTKSAECVVDPRTKLRRSLLTRQGTSESSGDILDTDSAGNGAVFENLCNGSDSEGDATDPTSLLLNRYRETTFIKASPLTVSRHGRYKMSGMSTSVGDLLETRSFGDFLQKRKAMSLNNMKRASSDATQESFISPIKEENVISILDDDLLDGNMEDILFSVETLWPKTNK
ncbi:hypothetical protein CHS0354_015751 [Potamilus streckersoni]|uniref:Uncharacterized protein n=1 Tax=Potamilus streckersoni TaxID=2493646 RepID=A0AAE0W5Q5_9BIVA|nr:hypothetical protein CHS0354_015751 [Potamilus streckersoni]